MDYSVLSPWAEVDPVPARGISTRPADLNGKTIGLLGYFKKWAMPILNVMEKNLQEKFPTAKFSYYIYTQHNAEVMKTPDRDKFTEWLKGVDCVVSAYGD